MSIISVSGEPGCPHDELAGLIAQKFSADLLTEAKLQRLIETEFPGINIPDKAWKYVLQIVIARIASARHVVIATAHSTAAVHELPQNLRVHLTSTARTKAHHADLVLNSLTFTPAQMCEVVEAALTTRGLSDEPISHTTESPIEFNARLKLAKFGISPPLNGNATTHFTHPSEQIFANLLDFYRIRWEYEPRSFPLQWDKDGKVTEAFTPDFYLPESDQYVELTTMKQSLVTKKNRKVRLLRAIYPHINIRVFYERDFHELVSKYGLADRAVE